MRKYLRALGIALLLFVLTPAQVEAANKFWVGGTGALDGVDTTHISDSSGGAGGATYPAAGDTLTFDAASGGGTVTFTATVTLTNLTMGEFTGTIDTNDQTVNLSSTFTVSGSGARTLLLGASAINVVAWTATTVTNLTFDAETSTLTHTGGVTFAGGGLTYNDVVIGAGINTTTVTGANTFDNLTFQIGGAAAKTYGVNLSDNQTVTGVFTVNGNSSVNRFLVRSSVRGTARTITAGTVTVSNSDWQDIVGAGTGSWNISASTGLAGDCGGNSSITFTSPVTNYWIGGTGNWDAVAEWASTSGGSASSGRVPLCQDAAVFDANSFSAGSQTVTQNMTRFGSANWTGVTNTPTWTTSTTASFFGSITLVSGMTLTASSQTYTYEGRGSSTLTSAGKTWAKPFTIAGHNGSLALGDALTTTGAITFNFAATFTSNNHNVTASLFLSSGWTGILNMGSSTWTSTGGSNPWSFSGGTINAGTSTIVLSNVMTVALTFAGGGYTYYNLWNNTTGAFALQFTGSNTFNQIRHDSGRTWLLTAATVTSFADLIADGVTIGSITAASHTLTKIGGKLIIAADGATISRSTATPSGIFFATGASTDNGNNSGWTFGSPTMRGVIIQ